MDLFTTRSYDGKFMRPNSALPIAGTVASTAFNRVLTEVKMTVAANAPVFQGMGLTVTGGATASNAGKNLAPNVLNAVKAADNTSANAFLVDNANSVVLNGSEFPQVLNNQIVRVATIGSGAEIYLPCDANFAEGSVVKQVAWDATAGKLIAGTAFTVTVRSQVVDGIKGKVDNGNITTEPCYVVKVKI